VHFLRDASLDTEDFSVWRTGASADRVWRRYFETIAEAARSGLYDVMAHPRSGQGLGRAGPRPDGDLRRFYEPAVEAFADAGVAVEVSTAGLRKPVGRVYPSAALLEMVVDAGCPIALSSDAHTPGAARLPLRGRARGARPRGRARDRGVRRRTRRMEPLG
jgi:histidinol-phosphatase (PHP family)